MTAGPRSTVARAVAAALAEAGVEQAFGLVGSGNFAVTLGLVECGVRWVPARHEGGALVMADAYARVSGRVPACTVHQGPGLTNLVTGLTEAAKSRTPLLVLAADIAADAVRSNFRIDQEGLVAAVGALSVRLRSPATAVAEAAAAYRLARRERRPVVVHMPLDVQGAPAPDGGARPAVPPSEDLPPVPDPDAIAAAAALLARARRPLIIAGRGAVLSGARKPAEQLGDRLGALLATSAAGHGLFAGNPWALGISGGFATPLAQELIPQADVVLALGATLNMWTTRHGRLLAGTAALVQADLDRDAIGAHRAARAGLLGDAGVAATLLDRELERRGGSGPGWRNPQLAARIAAGRWRDEPYQDAAGGGRIDPRTLSIRLDELLPAERTLATDSGHFMGYPPMYMAVPDPAGFVFAQAFQSVGLGLASAIGAAVARPDRLTVAALGDGGTLMGLSELETAIRLRLRMLIVVYNDAAYGAEVHHFGPSGQPLDLVRFPDTDFAALARGAGAEAVTVRASADLEAVTDWLRRSPSRPLLLDAKVVPTVVAEWLEEAFSGH